MASRIDNNFIHFQASIGNVCALKLLLPRVIKQDKVKLFIEDFSSATPTILPVDQRPALKQRITADFGGPTPAKASLASIFRVKALLPQFLSGLELKDLASAAATCTQFQEQIPYAILQQLKTKTHITSAELVNYQRFLHLSFFDDIFLVCPELSEHLTGLNLAHSKIDDRQLRSIVRHCPNLTSVNLSNCKKLHANSLNPLAEHCPHLKTIGLCDIGGLFEDAALVNFAKRCTELTEIALDGSHISDERIIRLSELFPNLTSIKLGDRHISSNTLALLGKNCPQLTAVHLRSKSGKEILTIVPNWPSLTEVHLESCGDIETPEALTALNTHCPKIKKIILNKCKHFFTDNAIISLVKGYPQLTSLSLIHSDAFHPPDLRVTDTAILAIGQSCKNLTEVRFSGFSNISIGVMSLLQNCERLTSIDLSDCPNITHSVVKSIVKLCPGLVFINLKNTRVRGPAIFDLAVQFPRLRITSDISEERLNLFKRESHFLPQSFLGKLYYASLRYEKSPEGLDILLNQIKDKKFIDLVYDHICQFSCRTLNRNWIEKTYDKYNTCKLANGYVASTETYNQLRNTFFLALQRSIIMYFNQLPLAQKNALYVRIYQLAGSPATKDPRWGEHHAKDNTARLAEALSEVVSP